MQIIYNAGSVFFHPSSSCNTFCVKQDAVIEFESFHSYAHSKVQERRHWSSERGKAEEFCQEVFQSKEQDVLTSSQYHKVVIHTRHASSAEAWCSYQVNLVSTNGESTCFCVLTGVHHLSKAGQTIVPYYFGNLPQRRCPLE